MSIQGILIFILFLGPLIFFHELGHFFFARLFGVRVETFSIGFGPKILRFRKGDTEYVVSAIPLGGYVKMFGDDPLKRDEIAEEDRAYSYNFKSKFARFWIVMGGPLANFIMAFFIFTLLSMVGEKIPEMRLGQVKPGVDIHTLGFRTGDTLKQVNGKDIYNPSDIMGDGSGFVNTVTVGRAGVDQVININLEGKDFFDLIIKYPPVLLAPTVFDKAGTAYLISKSSATRIEDFKYSLEQMAEMPSAPIYFYKIKNYQEQLLDKLEFESEPLVLNLEHGPENFLKVLRDSGYYSSDVKVQKVKIDSAASHAGIIENDILIKMNGIEFYSFSELKDSLQKTTGDSVAVTIIRNGEEQDLQVKPFMEREGDKVVKLIGVYSDARHMTPNYIHTEPLGIFGALGMGAVRSYEAVLKTIDGFVKLITGSVSFKNIGGPVTIGKVAQDSFNISLTYFFQIMAMISVNLGVINLFPIPILDGGHIMFLLFEAINGGPLSRRKMEIAQMVGLSIILLLMSGALFNDFSRWF